MDTINRKVIIDLLMGFAAEKPGQFFFLSPQDISNVAAVSDKVRVLKLRAPDRNQGVLPFAPANANAAEDD